MNTEQSTPQTTAEHTPWHRRLRRQAPEFLRYLAVGGFNTLFGYGTFVIILTLLNAAVPARFVYLTVILASVLSTPLNITVAFLGYKFFVFRTRGNFIREWLKCFAVYGTGMLPGLLVLSALTRALQSLFHRHSDLLHRSLAAAESHLRGAPLALLEKHAHTADMAGYVAGALVIGFTTIFSFIGHKKVTFRKPPA